MTAKPVDTHENPPTTFFGILRRIGPGLIVAGSIVGSGELIATTKTGAEAGFWLLWLILIGCIIKVFCQVEFGRYAVTGGVATMQGLNEVPGPTVSISLTGNPQGKQLNGNWIVWYWFLMWMASIAQLGGIVGGVGQALAISLPLTDAGREFNEYVDLQTERTVREAELNRVKIRAASLIEENQHEPVLKQAEALQKELDVHKIKADAAKEKKIRQMGEAYWKLHHLEEVDHLISQQVLEKLQPLLEESSPESAKKFASFSRAFPKEEDLIYRTGLLIFENNANRPPAPPDDKIWAAIIAVITSVVLFMGRYGFIQLFSTVLVGAFTVVTVVNVAMLQMNPTWAVSWEEFVNGMSFRLPPADSTGSATAVATALAAFGIIGVGASELVSYPYWCLEKGYARFTGPHENTNEWAERARGWMRVMRWDAWLSMFVYTFATIAFYLLGAAVLGRTGLNPEKSDMVRTLAVMYEPVFGESADILFLFGAFAVLYSTYFVANAAHARVFSDALRVLRFADPAPAAHARRVRWLSGIFPLLCLVIYVFYAEPAQLVLLSGLMQAIMLPMLAIAALFFRYRRCDRRIAPGMLWDIFLWVSAAGMLMAGLWAFWSNIAK